MVESNHEHFINMEESQDLSELERRISESREGVKDEEGSHINRRVTLLEDILMYFIRRYDQEMRDMEQEWNNVNTQLNKMVGGIKLIAWTVAGGMPTIIALLAFFGMGK